ncbi:MAG: S41 family peptidase [Oceanicaulis sp.]
MLKITAGALAALSLTSVAAAQTAPETWLRQPAISPDGSQILFSAWGDVWRVPAQGGTATPVTVDDSWDGHAVWSRDGSKIAFASDRFGDLDVFVMNADGSGLTRLTHHSADDRPSDFSPDGARVLFSSARGDSAASSYFPTGALPELYEVSLEGGAPRMVSTVPAEQARYSPGGGRIAYREEKAYESELRQRDVSSFARDIWIVDLATGEHEQVTDNPGGDHAPAWDGENALFLLSERDGDTFNVWRLDLESGEHERLSDHGPQPARELSASGGGLLAYSQHGELYTVRRGESPQRLDVRFPALPLRDAPQPFPVAGRISEFAVSPDGKEIAFVARGEVFVTSADFATTVRITNTPEQERSVDFHPDGRALVYAGNREGAWSLYETRLTDANEPRFSAATRLEERRIFTVENGEAFQPLYSPDGNRIAFIENRDAVAVINRDGSNRRVLFSPELNYSYADGDISFDWSPDSNWVTASYISGSYFYNDIGVAPADGSAPPRNISISGYGDNAPVWHPSGEAIMWISDRYGERSHGSWGSEVDVVATFLTQAAWDRFNLTEDERALLKEIEEEENGGEDGEASDRSGGLFDFFTWIEAWMAEDLEIEFDRVEDRTVRLTMHSSSLADAAWSEDYGKLYYLSRFEGGFDLWVQDLFKDETKKLASLGARSASIEQVDDSTAILLADGGLRKVTLSSGSVEPIQVSGEMTLRADAERAYFFEHVWRQVEDKFYDPGFHGLDWDATRAAYEPKVGAVSNNRDFATLMSEMLGELNASHTGMRYRAGESDDDSTAALGAVFDLAADGPGLVIAEVLPGGPLDREGLNIAPGTRITAISGVTLTETTNPFSLLNRVAGERIRMTVRGPGALERPRDVIVRTYSRGAENEALYERWIDRRRALVEEASNGRIGYVHIRSMSDSGYRQIYGELMGRNFNKDAVVVDTRFNGGGWLHDDLLVLLSGEPYFNLRARDRIIPGAPEERWTKPSAVVMNEGNYSNAHMFPFAYQLFGIGPLVGMPVPGTGTAVWWETLMSGDLVFGIPQLPVLDQENQPVENQTLQPDILVDNPPEAAANGEDLPLIAAVEVLLEGLDN